MPSASNASKPAVRPVDDADWAGFRSVMGRAFADDPVMEFVISAPPPLQPRAGILCTTIARAHAADGSTFAAVDGSTGEILGGASWAAPGHWRVPIRHFLRSAPTLLRAIGVRSVRRLPTMEAIERNHPSEPHYYLALIGTDPRHQGRGVGSALMEPMIDRCDEEGVPAYLESSKQQNLAFYHRFGFELTRTLTLKKGPTMYLMWRRPR